MHTQGLRNTISYHDQISDQPLAPSYLWSIIVFFLSLDRYSRGPTAYGPPLAPPSGPSMDPMATYALPPLATTTIYSYSTTVLLRTSTTTTSTTGGLRSNTV